MDGPDPRFAQNTYIDSYIHRSRGTLFDQHGARSGSPLWKFFVDKNRSTAIASILRFVSEFLQSISLAIEFLQSILVRRSLVPRLY